MGTSRGDRLGEENQKGLECDLHGFRVTLEMTADMVETGLLTSEGKGIGRDSVGKISNLPTQRWLRRVQHSLRCHRQVSRVGNRDEVAKMP